MCAASTQPLESSWSPSAVMAAEVSGVKGLLYIIAKVSFHLVNDSSGTFAVAIGAAKFGVIGVRWDTAGAGILAPGRASKLGGTSS